jgi:3'-phosphoadenosine 5'-phosphosulfate sulfotransferase (PAPS reductase)/FAD synthetase
MILSPTAIDPAVIQAITAGAVVAFSISGGKDSTAALQGATELLDQLGHPPERRIAIHADLGRAEWRSTPSTVEAVARRFNLKLIVVRHGKHDMVSRWEARFEEGKRRYINLEVFNLIGPWSSASLRFCTSELKQQVIARQLQKMFPGQQVISVVGIRREESTNRAQAPIYKPEPRWARNDGFSMLTWHPALDWKADEVFYRHHAFGLPLHEAYTAYGVSRLSCAFCVLASRGDLAASARAPGNLSLLHHLVDLEARSTFSFQPNRWLADAAPDLLPASILADLARRRPLADMRRALEASLPAGLRYAKGWPPRLPTAPEARAIASTRRQILAHHGEVDPFPTADAVIARFAELRRAQAAKAERKAA